MSKLKPILFNTEMTKAILDDRKTTTRRVIKDQNLKNWYDYDKEGHAIEYIDEDTGKWYYPPIKQRYEEGNILWVRETWCEVPYETICHHTKDGVICLPKYAYRASSKVDYTGIWRPSIFMPFVAARIFLMVTSVHIEKLQDITEEQAINEGVGDLFIEDCAYDNKYEDIPFTQEGGLSIHQFARLWDSTVKKPNLPLYGWDANPYVWVIEFARIDKEGIPK